MPEKVLWLEWSKESFEKAKREKKPVLLDISAVWCHWCHRMDSDSYQNNDIAEFINENFIPIKVDTDKRPDINNRYTMGGWPTTAILTPKGEIITGSTYMTATQLFDMLVSTINFYKIDREKFERYIESTKKKEKQITPEKTIKLEKEHLSQIEKKITDSFDEEHHGFGTSQKFPMPEQVDYCLLRYATTKNRKMLEIAEKTLTSTTNIFDNEEGGFYRYAVQRNWLQPHHEKMLETNSTAVINYVNAFQLTGNNEFKKIAEKTAKYMQEKLLEEKQKWFYGSQDAEEEYYAKNTEERKKARKPAVDKTLYTNLNCIAVNAFLKAGTALDKPEYTTQAINTLEFLLSNCYSKEHGACHYYDGKPIMFGLLADNAMIVQALLSAFEATQEKKYLETAENHTEWIIGKFWDRKQQALMDSLKNEAETGYLKMKGIPLKENSIMAECLAKMSMATGKEKHLETAETILNSLKEEIEMFGIFSAPYGTALECTLNPVKISNTGKRDFFNQSLKIFEPRAIRTFKESKENTALICIGSKCLEPVKTIAELEKKLETI